ncbi:MAG: hypothetical protein H6718_31380 [Polyangiaceae bacterium]|nr:hypothetical protein [Myxococcales bacterium]MCB9589959.1 hypothetical protein [Polyangiaceae bacterium]
MRPQLLLLGTAFITMACAGGSAPGTSKAPESPGAQGYGQPAQPGYAPSEAEASADMAPPSPESASRSASGGAEFDEAPAKQRPGLGTTWGETRTSRISTSPFFRDDPTSPTAVTSFFYNDMDGVRAMGGSGFVSAEQGVVSVAGGALLVRLIDENGRPLPGMASGGKNFIVGSNGQRYIIQIKNNTGSRVEAVATVDGLDVIDGRDGSFSKRGYIVSPFSTVEIDGFRQSTETVASFRFGSVGGSYAARKGKARNVGVIGIAFFHERGSSWGWSADETRRRQSADPFPGQFAEPPPGW